MTSLTKNDYVKILDYYDLSIPKNRDTLKKQAETVLANKLCRCIKKVSPTNEARGIGICTRSIFKKKGLVRGTFKCLRVHKNVTLKKQPKRGASTRKKNRKINRKNKTKSRGK